MRIAPFLLLLTLLLSPDVRAGSTDEPEREISDGIIVKAIGQGGDFRNHQLMVWLTVYDDAAKKKVTAVLETLGLKEAFTESHMPFALMATLPGEKCDGQRVGSVSRARALEALEATGIVRAVSIRSFSNTRADLNEALQKKILGIAMQNARAKAQEIARTGGGQLGKLLGMEYEIESIGDARVWTLTRDRVKEEEPGGDKIRVSARYALR